ncbi:MAG: transcription antitermination factor NusB [Microbacteriaceae bacterium]
MSARHKARKAAFDLLYSAEQRGQSLASALDEFDVRETAKLEPITELQYVRDIVRGVDDNQSAIDDTITAHLKEWTLPRLFAVDRAILRLAVWELLYSETQKDAVRSEAIALAEEYGSDDASRFIAGVLGAIVRDS